MKLQIPDLNNCFEKTILSQEWKSLESSFTQCKRIIIFGNGGNLAVADHAAVDISRLTDKLGLCPGSGILASSLINDKGHDLWLRKWVEISSRGLTQQVLSNTLYIGISSSGRSNNVVNALNFASSLGSQSWLITASPLKTEQDISFNTCCLSIDEYHSAEVMTLLLTYQLIHASGHSCPSISSSSAPESPSFDFK